MSNELKTCYRCGKENIDVHTCFPSKQYMFGFMIAYSLSKKAHLKNDPEKKEELEILYQSFKKYFQCLKDKKNES